MTDSVPTLDDVEAAVAGLIQPLRQQLQAIEARERLIVADLEQTRAAKARLVSTLRKLDPTMAGPGRPKAKSYTDPSPEATARRRREATEAARKAIDAIAASSAGGEVTKNRVVDQMKADGFAIGQGRGSSIVDDLHQSGYLTLDRLGTGGHKIYKRTEDLSNGSPRQAV